MNKTILTLVTSLLMAFFPLQVKPQSSQNDLIDNAYISLSVGTATDFGSKAKGLVNNFIEGSIGYFVIPNAFVYARYEGGMRLFEIQNVNTYYRYQNLGGGIGWRFYKSAQYGAFDWKTDYSWGLGRTDWKNQDFGTGVSWKLPTCRIVGVSFALGCRYYKSKTYGITSKAGAFASIGFSF